MKFFLNLLTIYLLAIMGILSYVLFLFIAFFSKFQQARASKAKTDLLANEKKQHKTNLFPSEKNQITDLFGFSYISIYWLLFLSKFQKARASKAKTDRFASEENLQNLLKRKKVRNILSFSIYGHSVLFLTEQDRVPKFFLVVQLFSLNDWYFFQNFITFYLTAIMGILSCS